jgi:selenoprotein W-related protein
VAEEIFNNFRHNIAEIKLITSSGGVFEVTVDDDLIFSKKELDRFPDDEEVTNTIVEQGLAERAEQDQS